MPVTVYQINCQTPNHVYIGQSQDYERRVEAHRAGVGALFVIRHGIKTIKPLCVVETSAEGKRIEGLWFKILGKRGHIMGGCTSMDLRPQRRSRSGEKPTPSPENI